MGNAQGNFRCPSCGGYDIDQRWGEFSNSTSLICKACQYIFMDNRNTLFQSKADGFHGSQTSVPNSQNKQINHLINSELRSGVQNNAGLYAMEGFMESFHNSRNERIAKAQSRGADALHDYMEYWGAVSNRLTEIGLRINEELNLDREFFYFHNELSEHFHEMLKVAMERIQQCKNEKQINELLVEIENSQLMKLVQENLARAELVSIALRFAQPFMKLWYGSDEDFPPSLMPDFVDQIHKARDVIDETEEMDDTLLELFDEWENAGSAAFLIAETIEYQLGLLVESARETGRVDTELMDLIADAQQLLSNIVVSHQNTSRELIEYLNEIAQENS